MISAPELEFALDRICEQCLIVVGSNSGQFQGRSSESIVLPLSLQTEAMLKFESVM